MNEQQRADQHRPTANQPAIALALLIAALAGSLTRGRDLMAGWLAAGVTPHSFTAAIVTLRKQGVN